MSVMIGGRSMANTIGIFDHEVIGGREHRLPDGELYPTSPFVRIQLQQWFESEDGHLNLPTIDDRRGNRFVQCSA